MAVSRAWVYCRVSTKEQATNGYSLPDQARRCVSYCESNGLVLGEASNYDFPGVFADPGVSAWKVPLFCRPGFIELWKSVRPGDTIVILALDRAFRSVLDFSQTWPKFESSRVSAVFVEDEIDMSTATGRLIANVSASFAQFKSDMISQRVREGAEIRRDLSGGDVRPRTMRRNGGIIVPKRMVEAMKVLSPEEKVETPESPGRVFGYVRVSTKSQIDSVDSQRERVLSAMRSISRDHGYTIPIESPIIEDIGVSAYRNSLFDRENGKRVRDLLRPGDCLVALRVDRLFRSVIDMSRTMDELLSDGIDVMTCCGINSRTETGRSMIEILGLMAEWESRVMRRQYFQALEAMRETRGKWYTGQFPFYITPVRLRDGGISPRINWSEIRRIRKCVEMRNSGAKWREISSALELDQAEEQGRWPSPRSSFSRQKYIYLARKNGCTEDVIRRSKKWLKTLKKSKDGHVNRTWNERTCEKVYLSSDRIFEFCSLCEDSGIEDSSMMCLSAAG